MKLTVYFCITTIDETKKEVRNIDSKLKSILPYPEYKTVHKQITINEGSVIQQLRRKKPRNIESMSKVNKTTKNQNDNVCITQTRNKDNQQRESKENKLMPTYAAILKNGRQKQKTHKSKNEEPERLRKINRNFQQPK